MNSKIIISTLSLILVFTALLNADEKSHNKAALDLIETMGIAKMIKQSNERMVALQVKRNSRIQGYEDVLQKFYDKYSNWDVVKKDVLKMYTETFTEKELKELNTFYKSPTGQKALSKMPALMVKTIALGQQNIEKNLPELQAEIEKRKAQENK